MGTGVTYPSGEQFNREEWNIDNSNPRCVVWENRRDSTQRIEQYTIPSFSQQEQKQQKEAYYLRKNHPQIIAALFFHTQDSSEFCSTSYQQQIFLQKIPIRLSDVEHIPYPDYLHLYHQCLHGYSELANFFGFFHAEEEFIGINERGIVKVWINEHYESIHITGRRITQDEMVKSIVDLVHNNLDYGNSNAVNVRNFLYRNSDKLSFKNALEEFSLYLRNFCNSQIPHRLYCVDKVGIYTIANRQNQIRSQNNQTYLEDNRAYSSPYMRKDSRPRLAYSQIYKPEPVAHLNLTPRHFQVNSDQQVYTNPSPIVYSNLNQNSHLVTSHPRAVEQSLQRQGSLQIFRQSSVHSSSNIFRPSAVRQNVEIIRKPLQDHKVKTVFQNRPVMMQPSGQLTNINPNLSNIHIQRPLYAPQPIQINQERNPISKSVVFQPNTKVNNQIQPNRSVFTLNPNKYSIIQGIYPQEIPPQNRISNQVNILSQSTHLPLHKVPSQSHASSNANPASYQMRYQTQPTRVVEPPVRNDFVALHREDNRPSSNHQQRMVSFQQNIQPNSGVYVQQNAASVVQPRFPPATSLQQQNIQLPLHHQAIIQPQPVSSGNLANKIQQRQHNYQIQPLSGNINQVKTLSYQSSQNKSNVLQPRQNVQKVIPAQQTSNQDTYSVYNYQKSSAFSQNKAESNPSSFRQQKYNPKYQSAADYNVNQLLKPFPTNLNARQITSIDPQDGKSSQDFLKKLRQFSSVNNEKILFQEQPSYLKRLDRQEYIFNTGVDGAENGKYSWQYPSAGAKYSKEFQYGGYNDKPLWQVPQGVKYSKEFQYNTEPISYNFDQFEPTYQGKYQVPSSQQLNYQTQANQNQFNNKNSYTTSSNQSNILNNNKMFNFEALHNSEEQLGKSAVSNIIQTGNETPINNVNAYTFHEPLKFQKDLEMKHSIFKADYLYTKYDKNYNSNLDDDLLADMKKLKESQLYQNL